MSFRIFGCGKYRRLMNEKHDRLLQLAEREFMAKHRSVCTDCRKEETIGASALNMLRLASFEEEEMEVELDHGVQFEERVMRRWRIASTRESVRYWSPAFVGAAIAGLTILAAMQLVANRPGMPSTARPIGEARNMPNPNAALPAIDIDQIDRSR